ncbi:Oar protein [Polymorphobacter multimanifer]|uniref:Outer membrane receptor protein involved in Fe transport n=1 Tax=Polymorphobacter multimanifer TaxID=1070431 RepID=A0A841LE48_9SPHN|nr:TonB-dependent receptor [Polymorphobacter multimanifer]MBB6227432.1 outer membrane receptor protein involved in Fe transport [Polymorphobacter multimanifer]GGI78950.1 Oar protein [Polymorphobacter multimanifer]
MRYLRIGCALAALAAPMALHAQDTASSIRGQVASGAGVGIPNATVLMIHTPSGTRSTVTTDASGNFNASGLRIGGPYSIDVSADGYDAASETIASLAAGTPQRITVYMAEVGQTITVTAARQRSTISIASGPATVLTAEDIRGISTVNRDIRNLAVRNPLVSLDPTNGGAISIAGQNNRFNRISVDGIQFGDPFGLEAGGLASARGPVPLDAIAEFTVEIAPVDIQQGGFQGGAINTQLKSGGNNFTAQGFFTYSSDSLAGTKTRGIDRPRDFESKIFGAQLTGPIIKDKLFFAVTWERLRDATPSAVQAIDLGISQGEIDQVNQIATSRYNFDAGQVANNVEESDDKVVAKIDWNIADGHRAALTYIYNEGSLLAGQTGLGEVSNVATGNATLALFSNNYNQGSINHYGVFQLNDQWSDTFSTQLRVSYNDYVRLQEPFGDKNFGQFQVCLQPGPTPVPVSPACPAGQQRISFGPDVSRQANELSAQTLGIEFQAQLKMNNHTVKLIAERRGQDFNNLFAQNVSGNFRFDSLGDLQNGRANSLTFAAPLRGGIDTVRALFSNNVYTFGLQDVWNATDTLTLTAGFRWDLYETPDTPLFNENFLARTGFANNASLNGRQVFQPRVAATWAPSDRLNVRASAGLFAGGNPNVWISNNYSNPGPTLGSVNINRVVTNGVETFTIGGLALSAAEQNRLGALALNNVTGGQGIPQELINGIQGGGSAAATTNVLDPNFQIPSQWRIAGTVDYAANLGFLGDDWNFGADVVWSRVKNALTYTDLRSVPNTVQGTLPDGRQRYQAFNAAAGVNTDLFLTNTNLGYSWNVVARVDKRWLNGFFFNAAYTFQRAKDVNSGTSSTAGSNYGNAAAGIDSNNGAYGTSNYQIDDAYRLNVGFDKALFGDNNTRVELFFNSRAGQRFSYTFADLTPNRSAVFGTVQSNSRYLIYVPNVASQTADPLVQYAPGFDFAGFQRVVQNTELNKYQGQIAPKNIGRSPRFNKLDISVRQELPFVFGGKLEVFGDIENVLNLVNSNWGSLRQVAFPYYGTLVNVSCVSTATPDGVNITTPGQACAQYRYSNRSGTAVTEPAQALFQNQSLWQIRVGARVRF